MGWSVRYQINRLPARFPGTVGTYGFLVHDELAAYGATLRMPHFTKGKKQLPAQEVDTSRQLARVRIHRASDRKGDCYLFHPPYQ